MVSTSSISAVNLVNQHGLNWKADSSLFNLNYLSLIISGRNRESRKFHIRALMAKPDIDFTDPKWKNKFQESFDRRFDLPHLRDSLEVKPRSTTFSLKSRVPLVDGNGDPEDTWNGYVNDDDRALLKMRRYFKEADFPADVKYIDPTYMIRACRANASDAILCTVLGQNAVITRLGH